MILTNPNLRYIALKAAQALNFTIYPLKPFTGKHFVGYPHSVVHSDMDIKSLKSFAEQDFHVPKRK